MKDNHERAVRNRMAWPINGYDHFTSSTRIDKWTVMIDTPQSFPGNVKMFHKMAHFLTGTKPK